MLLDGKSQGDVANELNCSAQTVTNIRKQLGLPPARRGPKPKPISGNWGRTRLRPNILEKINASMAAGDSQSDVARKLGVSKQYVSMLLNPKQARAREETKSLIACGEIRACKKCQICGSDSKLQTHHSDYSMPELVIWVCSRCHGAIHSKHILHRARPPKIKQPAVVEKTTTQPVVNILCKPNQQEMSRKGGQSKSPKKLAAVRRNIRKAIAERMRKFRLRKMET